MSTGVYCGIGAHDQCVKPRCGCQCHSAAGRTNSLVDAQRGKVPRPRSVKRRAPSTKIAAHAVFDSQGRRVCEECRLAVLVKKDPQGRGRYPRRCAQCKTRPAVAA